ncbi:histidine kinase [Nocardioides sp. CER19]|uniref:sensor histidine kinase n=1 Tax=Nocardioides sp. CER19 TaxID=3038538 RepID=UPI00244C526C|nr:histidine kinase [Nocardioides sp. CER19]MDH2413377.1 histidine kinase [Nocardioides sp. CER19]
MSTVRDRLHAPRGDAALAGVLVVAGLVQALVTPFAAPLVGVVYVVGTTLPLAWRRTRPVEVAVVSAAFWLIPLDGFPLLGFVTAALIFYALGAWGRPTGVVVGVTGFATACAVLGTLLGPEAPVAAIGAVLIVVAPVLAGRVVAHERARNAALAEVTAQLEEERQRVQESAVAAERARIAQELHDVVGHELTLIAIQAEAAAAALRSAPERAAEPVDTIRATAHRTLGSIRQTLDVLAPLGSARPSYDGLDEVVRRATDSGIDGSLVVTGTPWPGQAAVWLAVTRIVGECLTNAGRHAPGSPVEVVVDWRPDRVHVLASNPVDGRGRPAPGRGLTGMRHRAELLGGEFAARTDDGRFTVDVSLPAEPVRVVR